jgi:uncharacterized FlaG/YvyC family protein
MQVQAWINLQKQCNHDHGDDERPLAKLEQSEAQIVQTRSKLSSIVEEINEVLETIQEMRLE